MQLLYASKVEILSILRIGKEAWNSVNAIVQALQEGIEQCGVNPNIVQLIQDTTHQSANELMEGVAYIDLLIPRGGKKFNFALYRTCRSTMNSNRYRHLSHLCG